MECKDCGAELGKRSRGMIDLADLRTPPCDVCFSRHADEKPIAAERADGAHHVAAPRGSKAKERVDASSSLDAGGGDGMQRAARSDEAAGPGTDTRHVGGQSARGPAGDAVSVDYSRDVALAMGEEWSLYLDNPQSAQSYSTYPMETDELTTLEQLEKELDGWYE
ncbi:uncharacterized protein MAM_07371 [Metarhizium album ARSEF 1941]|uniref:Uncharacterized protein n=1 Tax=Metarhizium album (strain ARSEF 1941) TaxID=1081103 RepID=A0A0B2WP62_METAS|nr:uncharacterized protein MAM_07371 [Metarhizium album ARSEF 1941]KHN94775.1 hypothetical protein MAM_07371 [Metarhizium album ARSEF 1941]